MYLLIRCRVDHRLGSLVAEMCRVGWCRIWLGGGQHHAMTDGGIDRTTCSVLTTAPQVCSGSFPQGPRERGVFVCLFVRVSACMSSSLD